MSRSTQKLELTANILIIVVAVLSIGVTDRRYFFSPPTAPDPPAPVHPAVGTKINLPDTDLSAQPKTPAIALQKGCRFCSESAPFYQRLRESARSKNVEPVAVLPGRTGESVTYLGEPGIGNLDVKQWPLKSLQIGGAPTLILTNDEGDVTDYWVGKLSPEEESEVVGKL